MRRTDFSYHLPPELIAQHPPAKRGDSRLLVLSGAGGAYRDAHFRDLPGLLVPGDLLVLNDTRVIRARLLGRKATGGRVELLVERVLDAQRVLAHLRASKPPAAGSYLLIEPDLRVQVSGRSGDLYELAFPADEPVLDLLERVGRVPLPPYIEREPDAADQERYQTVYARHRGAVAAPTAGLHFDAELLAELRARGIATATVTLHVGAGTFRPVRADEVRDHRMHAEWMSVPPETVAAVAAARQGGRRVVAVGTTVVRALESAAQRGDLQPFEGETSIFIYPGYRFRVVDALLTNFHLPESTLLMLVAAFAGTATVLAAYRHAVAQRYRFFSYGDAMFLSGAHPDAGSGARVDAI